MLAGVVVDAFAKAGMKSGMDGVDPVANTKTRKTSMLLVLMQRNRSNHAQRHEHPTSGNGVTEGGSTKKPARACKTSIMVEERRFLDAAQRRPSLSD